ncbi:hypothetical protein DYU05_03915 [Mucilaginibacter terrenus]|uniref:Uncharacterized protein n=1 Tax=Mucilaginibacter terrenus TaxID=2482727 RepID=A0A3E2NV22_9SPHI|nr:hypothetical protein [Mucilaginibacter terrenus]RFZ84761.1 hypothetical protein DYU05_03915 [Mucilaginibacter terrenus]
MSDRFLKQSEIADLFASAIEAAPVYADEEAATDLPNYTLYKTPGGELRYKLAVARPEPPTNGIVDDENYKFTFTGGTL